MVANKVRAQWCVCVYVYVRVCVLRGPDASCSLCMAVCLHRHKNDNQRWDRSSFWGRRKNRNAEMKCTHFDYITRTLNFFFIMYCSSKNSLSVSLYAGWNMDDAWCTLQRASPTVVKEWLIKTPKWAADVLLICDPLPLVGFSSHQTGDHTKCHF